MTFVEPVGTPLGIQFMEYESKLGPQHYLLINGLSDTARQTHPELITGMIATKVNGQPTARMPSTEKVREMLAVRPVTVTFTDRMADAETAMTLGVVNARVKWKALVERNRSRWSKGFVLARGDHTHSHTISVVPGCVFTPIVLCSRRCGAAQPGRGRAGRRHHPDAHRRDGAGARAGSEPGACAGGAQPAACGAASGEDRLGAAGCTNPAHFAGGGEGGKTDEGCDESGGGCRWWWDGYDGAGRQRTRKPQTNPFSRSLARCSAFILRSLKMSL